MAPQRLAAGLPFADPGRPVSPRRLSEADVDRAMHASLARVATIRMAVTTLMDNAIDADTRTWLLSTAEREAVRLAGDLAAHRALVACLADRSPRVEVEIATALREAGTQAAPAGARLRVASRRPALALVRRRCLEAVLPALVRLVADGEGEVKATARREGDGVIVRLGRADAADFDARLVAEQLVRAVGGAPVPQPGGVAFRIPAATR